MWDEVMRLQSVALEESAFPISLRDVTRLSNKVKDSSGDDKW
jgi:hypothetical protein